MGFKNRLPSPRTRGFETPALPSTKCVTSAESVHLSNPQLLSVIKRGEEENLLMYLSLGRERHFRQDNKQV